MPRSIASINSIAFVPYKRLGVVSEFIYGVLNYLYVKYLMRNIYIYIYTCFDHHRIRLEEIFRLLNSLKSFIFISTTKRIKNDFEKKTLLLHMHIYINTHTTFISDKFLQYWKKKKGGIKKHSHTNKWRTLFQLNKYFTRDKSKHEWGAILAHELEITVQNPANFLFQSARPRFFRPPRLPRVKSAGNRDRVNAIAIEQNSCSNAGIRVPPLPSFSRFDSIVTGR